MAQNPDTNPIIDDIERQYKLFKDQQDQKMRGTLAVNLSYFLLRSGETQAKVAEKTGISTSALNSYVRGTRYPRPGQLDALAKYFHVSVGELTDDPTERNKSVTVSDEAKKIAYSFDELDLHGRELVRIIIQNELNRVRSTGDIR